MALFWRPQNLLLEHLITYRLPMMKSIPLTTITSYKFMHTWFRIGLKYQSSFPSHVVVGSSDDNQTQVLMQALMYEEGFQKNLINNRFMTFGANGVSVSQGTMSSVTKQIVDGWALHSMGVALYGSYN